MIREVNENYVKESFPRENILLDLVFNEEFRREYLSTINVDEYTNETFSNLKKDLKKARKKQNSFVELFKLHSIMNDSDMQVLLVQSKLNEFERNLSYLLCLDVISVEEAINRGFNREYIEKTLTEAQYIVNNPYNHYFEYFDTEERQKVKSV